MTVILPNDRHVVSQALKHCHYITTFNKTLMTFNIFSSELIGF